MMGLVSTIIPVFNRPGLLQEAVDSVLRQSYRPIEIIIVDDGSTDSTVDVIERLRRAAPDVIRSVRQENSGPGPAREVGRQAALGQFIQYLDSDDLLLPRKFEAQVSELRAHPECGIAYGKTQFQRSGEVAAANAHRRTGERIDSLFPALLASRWWCTQTPLYRRSLTDRIGPWRGLWNEEDWEYDARAGALGTKLCFCDEFVSVQRAHRRECHLCDDGAKNWRKLRDRARAHELIFSHARTAGINADQLEMQHFARELFLLARQCGSAGLATESEKLFNLARTASTPERAKGPDFLIYSAIARTLGWGTAGRLGAVADGFRRRTYA